MGNVSVYFIFAIVCTIFVMILYFISKELRNACEYLSKKAFKKKKVVASNLSPPSKLKSNHNIVIDKPSFVITNAENQISNGDIERLPILGLPPPNNMGVLAITVDYHNKSLFIQGRSKHSFLVEWFNESLTYWKRLLVINANDFNIHKTPFFIKDSANSNMDFRILCDNKTNGNEIPNTNVRKQTFLPIIGLSMRRKLFFINGLKGCKAEGQILVRKIRKTPMEKPNFKTIFLGNAKNGIKIKHRTEKDYGIFIWWPIKP